MQDAMTIWDSICHSQWFKQTSIVRCSLPSLSLSEPFSPIYRFCSWTRTIFSSGRSPLPISRRPSQWVMPSSSPLPTHPSLHTLILTFRALKDYEGESGDVRAGRDYFKRRFAKLAQKAGRSKEREIYIQYESFFFHVSCYLQIS